MALGSMRRERELKAEVRKELTGEERREGTSILHLETNVVSLTEITANRTCRVNWLGTDFKI